MEEEKKIVDSIDPVNIEGTKKILDQMRKCICKIKMKEEFGTGFFCKFPNKKETLKVFMTNYHVLNEKSLEENKKLNLLLNDEKEILKIDLEIKRKTYFNKDYDITIIELKDEDRIEDYLELDDNLFQDDAEIIYVDKSIYILQYPNGQNACVSYGLLFNIDEYNISHRCSTEKGSSGSPILNLQNNKVIGIHSKGSQYNFNMGTLLKLPFQDFINKSLKEKIDRKPIIINNIEYKIIKELGQGGFGKLYQVLNKSDNKYYAIKEIPIKEETKDKIENFQNDVSVLSKINCFNIVKYYGSSINNNNIYILMEFCDGETLKSFIDKHKKNNLFIKKVEEKDKVENEANILKSLNHENIIKYYESFISGNSFFIIMEYCDKDLKQFIKEYKDDNNSIDQTIVCSIVLDICSGIKEIHKKNIIHRDLKPENIFINENHKIKIGDFGISKKLNNTRHTDTNNVGTDKYMAPELFENVKYDSKVDIWALGCIIYELFTLEECFHSDTPLGLINKIRNVDYEKNNLEMCNSEWKELIDSLLKLKPKDRPDIEEVYNKVFSLKNVGSKKNNEKKKDLKNSFSFRSMFKGCPHLEIVDVSIFENYNILDYSEMCQDCVKLKTIKLPTFHNENSIMDNMFKNCHNLQTIYVNSSLNINQLKEQLKKDNIAPEIIIK